MSTPQQLEDLRSVYGMGLRARVPEAPPTASQAPESLQGGLKQSTETTKPKVQNVIYSPSQVEAEDDTEPSGDDSDISDFSVQGTPEVDEGIAEDADGLFVSANESSRPSDEEDVGTPEEEDAMSIISDDTPKRASARRHPAVSGRTQGRRAPRLNAAVSTALDGTEGGRLVAEFIRAYEEDLELYGSHHDPVAAHALQQRIALPINVEQAKAAAAEALALRNRVDVAAVPTTKSLSASFATKRKARNRVPARAPTVHHPTAAQVAQETYRKLESRHRRELQTATFAKELREEVRMSTDARVAFIAKVEQRKVSLESVEGKYFRRLDEKEALYERFLSGEGEVFEVPEAPTRLESWMMRF